MAGTRTAGARAAECVAETENLAQDVAEIHGRRVEPAAAHAGQPLVAVGVVGGALLRIGKDAVSLRRFLELFFGGLIARIAVRMILHSQFAVGDFDLLLGRAALHAEHFVIIAFGHRHSL